ncbi:unnamed protein product [marine sediment metagenome]|uniref:Uncharacterized protein n=1 Tax=marine sediment metagenome TaxID=412755 RepID=X1NA38_9ZZZZ
MDDLEVLVKEYLENNYQGNISQIIKFLLEIGYYFDELSSVKEKIENILYQFNEAKILKYDSVAKDYTLQRITFEDFDKDNRLKNYGIILIANIFSIDEKSSIHLKDLNSFFWNYTKTLGNYSCIILNEENKILESSFETDFITTTFTLRQNIVYIRCTMNPKLEKKEPIYDYIIEHKNQFSAEKKIYIPLNFGIYLFYDALIQYIEKTKENFTIKITSITFEE